MKSLVTNLIAVAMALALPVTSAHAVVSAPPTVDYTFTGVCTDCKGSGVGHLTLMDYTLGATLSVANFVSFDYTSDLISTSFVTVSELSGALPTGLPSAADVTLASGDFQFRSSTSGYWCDGNACFDDFGQSHTWSVADAGTVVPEPASIGLLLSGLVLLGPKLRRR